MSGTRFIAGAALSLLGAPALAQSPFDGDWVADLDTQSGLPTDTYLVQDGRYACSTCEPPRAYPADGKPHAVPGSPDVISEAVTITGPRTMVTHIVGPPLDRTTTMTVSPDGQTATYVSVDRRPGINAALRTEYLARRIEPAPAGAHPVSGSWKGIRYVVVLALVRTTRLRLVGDQFSFSTPLGTSFKARLGGDYVPVQSTQAAGVTVAVRRTTARQIEEKIKRDGQLILVRTFTVSGDGRSMEVASTDPAKGTTFRATSRRAGSSGQ